MQEIEEHEAPAGVYSEETPDIDRINEIIKLSGKDALLPEEMDVYMQHQPVASAGLQGEHYANLADVIDQDKLKHIASDIITWVDLDIESREDWQRREARGMKLLGVTEKTEGGATFKGANKSVHPLLAEAVNQFHARAISEMWPAEGPVKTQVLGEITPEVNEQAERVKDYLNYLYTTKMPGAFEEEDQMLFRLPLSGSCFKKAYYDPLEDCILSQFVEPSDFIVPYTATNLRTAPRFTHRIKMHQNDLRKLQLSGYYIDNDLNRPTDETMQLSTIKDQIDDAEGRSNTVVSEDQRHTLYECYIDYIVDGVDCDCEDKKMQVALPYVVTVDYDNQRVLRVQRNWRPNDQRQKKRIQFTHYKFTPGFGFYGFGLLHLIGGLAESATGALRALLDSAAFANLPGGFRSRDAKLKGGDMAISPGEWKEVDSSAEELAKAFFRLPYEEPSQVMFQLLGYLDERSQRFVGTTENMVGEASANAAVGTTLALIEQGSKQFTAIHMRLHLAHSTEFRITAELCAEYLPEEGYPYAVAGGQNTIMASDFDERVDIIPVSDPNIISSTQRIAQAQGVLDLAAKFPNKINLDEAIRRMLVSMRVQDIKSLVIDSSKPDPMAQAMQELQLKEAMAKIDKLTAEIEKINSEKTEINIKALYESLQAAQAVAATPSIVAIADQISKSAGFVDQDGKPMTTVSPGTQSGSVPIDQTAQTNPMTPDQPTVSSPVQHQIPTAQEPKSPGLGVAQGIEQQGNQIEARASGGPIKQGQPYLVGEQGPEIVIPQNSGVVIPNNQIVSGMSDATQTNPPFKPQIQQQLEQDYPFSKNHNLVVTLSPGKMPYYAETFKPGDVDVKEEGFIRPEGTPLNSLGVEIYKPDKFTHHDLAGELLHADPVANNTRQYLQKTFTPDQIEMLMEQGDYKLPVESTMSHQDRMNNATDALIRGYVVKQWPKDAIDSFNLNEDQKNQLNNLMKYMKTGKH